MKLLIILISMCLQVTSHVNCEEKIAALILARGGSKGISLKNLQNVGFNSLLARAINTAKSAGLHDVTVSTDHFLIALESIKNGAKLLHRSYITAVDWAPSIWGASEFFVSRPDVSILVLIQATSPFTRNTSLRKAVRKIQGPVPYDCVFSVTKSYKLRWQYYYSNEIKPLNFHLDARPRRQDWDGELLETGSFYLARKHLIYEGVFQNKNCSVIEVSALESFEVDTNDDLRIANTLYTLEAIFTNKGIVLKKKMSNTVITYEDLEATDVISVELVPERKGLILKHCEYYVSSRRHGTTVTRRYNEFAQLYDVLFAKYPYRSVCRLPPKRVVVGGGSPRFLQRRRAALQRWLTLVARHPVLAHDADLRSFLCEISLKLDKPKHDEFTMAGTQEISRADTMSIEDMKAVFVCEQEQLRLMHLGLGRLCQIFEKVESRSEAERADIRELGAGFSALVQAAAAATAAGAAPRWASVSCALRAAADLASETSDSAAEELDLSEVSLALDALSAHRELGARLTRGLHGERAAAAAAAPHSPASQLLRDRHRYALRCSLEEAQLARAYALMALESLPSLLRAHGAAHARSAALWAALHAATGRPRTAAH